MNTMNTIKCGDCAFYDPILARNELETLRGWCVKRSVYPTKEGPGQAFHPEAKRRLDPKKLSKPFIVQKHGCVTQCIYAKAGSFQVEKKRAAQARYIKGERVLV